MAPSACVGVVGLITGVDVLEFGSHTSRPTLALADMADPGTTLVTELLSDRFRLS